MERASIVKIKYIKKHNAAIRSRSEMTLLQRKLANTLLYNAYHDLTNKDFHEITIPKLLSLLSMKTNNYKKLKNAIVQLMSTVIEWNVIKKDLENFKSESSDIEPFSSNECWKACTLLSSVQIDGTKITYEYSQILRELFYRPSFYSKVSLDIQNKFRSLYSLTLYENCLSYLNCGSSGWVKFEIFRKIMGVGESQYKSLRDFNNRVLKPAIMEINKISDIMVDYEMKKVKRIPSHIRLVISKNTEYQKITFKVAGNDFVKNKLLEYGFSDKDAEKTIKEYGENSVLEKISLMNESKVKIKIPVAFLKAALQQNYPRNDIQIKALKDTYLEEKEAERRIEQLKIKYRIYVDETYKSWLSLLDGQEKSYLIEEVKKCNESCSIPSWKEAKSKLGLGSWIEDPNVFLFIKICVMEKKGVFHFKHELPGILPMKEFMAIENQKFSCDERADVLFNEREEKR